MMLDSFSFQERHDYCWAACVQMVLSVYGTERSQQEIDTRGNGINPFNIFPNRSGNSFSIQNNFNELLFGQFHCIPGEGAPAADKFLDEIYESRPIIIGYYEGQDQHAVVAFGADVAPTHFGYSIQQVHVADPFPTRGIVSWEAGQFHQSISGHWIIHSHK
jgi:hypothetical protein